MKKNNFIEGALIASLAIILTKVIGVLYVIPFNAIFSAKSIALYGYAYNIYNLFLIMSTSGIPLAISKITSEYNTLKMSNEKKYLFSFARKVIIIFSIISFLICFIFAKPIASLINITGGNTIDEIAFAIRCSSFAILVVPSLSIIRGYLQGHNYITASALSQVVEQFFRVLVILLGAYLVIKVCDLGETVAIGVAIFGACFGAILAYIYLKIKSRKLDTKVDTSSFTKEEKKAIIIKFFSYVIPFVFITISGHFYNSIDMILLNRGLNHIGMSAGDIETISGIFTTLGNKLVSIVTAFGTGIVISLIPTLISAYVKKDHGEVNKIFNKALQILFFAILPIALFASLYSSEIWKVFYGNSYFGPIIMKYLFVVAFFDTSFTMTCSSLQGLNKQKTIYISILLGLGLNATLDIPLIYLFDNLGIYPYYGAITATLIGYASSLAYVLISLHKSDNLSYMETLKNAPMVLLKLVIALVVACLFKPLFKINTGRIMTLLFLAITGIVYVLLYYFLNKKIIDELLGKKLFKIFKKKEKHN